MRLRFAHALLALGAVLIAPFAGCGLSTYGTLELPKDACASASACDDQNPCTVDECSASGTCTHTSLDDGPTPTQVAGDCVRTSCADGALVTEAEDADVPHAGEPCIVGKCSEGQPSSQPKTDGTECALGAAHGSCANGGCVVLCDANKPCDDKNPCTTDSCDLAAGACVFEPLHGVATPGVALVDGDCRVRLCIQGVDTHVIDNDDLPVTPTDCDEERCIEGAPSNPPLSAGTACGTSGGAVCDVSGGCVECNVAADCVGLPADDACQTRTCTAGVCGQVFAPAGTVLLQQTAGDCVRAECDGQGATIPVPDGGDLPDDDNACTTDSCDGATPVHEPLAKDTSCGPNLVCSGGPNSVCQGCNAPTDCPGSETECKARTCEAGTCGMTYEADDKVIAAQTAGDCLEQRCDGAGKIKAAHLDGDVPVDGKECTDDVCSNGIASNPPTAINTTCAAGYCDGNGACGQCNVAAHCGAPANPCLSAVCNAHQCGTQPVANDTPTGNQTPGDCKKEVCIDGVAKDVINAGDLPAGTTCKYGVCNGMTPGYGLAKLGATCTENNGKACDGAGACVACTNNTHCTAPDTCGADHTCSCVPTTCAALGKTCGSPGNGCGANLSCGGEKNGSETYKDCGGDPAACATRCAQGQTCSVNGDCASGFCADGVCCDRACGGTCEACTAALKGSGSDGTCGFITAGQDPGNECTADSPASCGKDGTCNGAGACRLYDASTVCAGASCSGASFTPEGKCNGTGVCGAAVVAPCAGGFACSNASTCGTTCSTPTTGCAAGRYCAGVSCAPLKSQGAACGNGYECQGGNCVDGVCCDTACDGLCEACTAVGKGSGADGTCGPAKAGTDPRAQCTDDGAASCKRDGMCDGARACRNYAVGTECAAETCTGTSHTSAGTCSGPGACTIPQTTICANGFGCDVNGEECATSCTAPYEGCSDGTYCAGATCELKKANGESCTNGYECESNTCTNGLCSSP